MQRRPASPSLLQVGCPPPASPLCRLLLTLLRPVPGQIISCLVGAEPWKSSLNTRINSHHIQTSSNEWQRLKDWSLRNASVEIFREFLSKVTLPQLLSLNFHPEKRVKGFEAKHADIHICTTFAVNIPLCNNHKCFIIGKFNIYFL